MIAVDRGFVSTETRVGEFVRLLIETASSYRRHRYQVLPWSVAPGGSWEVPIQIQG